MDRVRYRRRLALRRPRLAPDHRTRRGTAPAGSPQPAEISDKGQAVRKIVHKTIDGFGDDVEKFRFNRAVARVRELTNALAELDGKGAGEGWVLREG